MTNYNDRDRYNREIYPNHDDTSGDSRVPRHTTQVTDNINQRERPLPSNMAYRDGFIQGRLSENRINSQRQWERDNDNAGRGLLIGILLTSLLGLTIGTVFMLNQRNNEANNRVPTLVVPRTNPAPAQSPQVRERVIERDRVVPVPQPVRVPDVNVTVPNVQAPAPAPATSSNSTNDTDTTPNSTGSSDTNNSTTGSSDQ